MAITGDVRQGSPDAAVLAEHQRRYAAAIRQARLAGSDTFFAWFNREAASDVQQSLVRGAWDFALHMLTPTVCAAIDSPEEQVALEIGYGGGRLLYTACNYFQEVIGIDIHAEQETVAALLRARQRQNFRLFQTDGATIDVASSSIDFIYSFIVLQHLPTFAVLVSYLHEVYRCLKPGGVAQLYFGKFARLHPVYQVYYLVQGYRETPGVAANRISLVVRSGKMRRLCRTIGFAVLEVGSSFFCVPDGYPQSAGGQQYVTLQKKNC